MIEPIVIKVVDKVPIVVSGPQYVVCDNSDYTVVWQLDEEWAQFESRTMQVNYKDGTYERVLFTGNSCTLPAIPVPGPVHVGLFAGDIHTTLPARLLAVRSATTDSGEERDPMPNGYAQAIKALDGKLDKNQGADNAGKALVIGDDGNVVPGEAQGGGSTEPGAWYVTITQSASGSAEATADKTPQEVFSAYQAGYAVYARVNFAGQMIQSILPLEAAIDSEAYGIIIGFAATGQAGKDNIATTAGALGYSMPNEWDVWQGQLAKITDIPDIPTALPNPYALTIKVGDNTTTYDGSAAKTVEVEGGNVTDEQVSSAVSTWLTAHPEATTTVQDGAVTDAKLSDDLYKQVTGNERHKLTEVSVPLIEYQYNSWVMAAGTNNGIAPIKTPKKFRITNPSATAEVGLLMRFLDGEDPETATISDNQVAREGFYWRVPAGETVEFETLEYGRATTKYIQIRWNNWPRVLLDITAIYDSYVPPEPVLDTVSEYLQDFPMRWTLQPLNNAITHETAFCCVPFYPDATYYVYNPDRVGAVADNIPDVYGLPDETFFSENNNKWAPISGGLFASIPVHVYKKVATGENSDSMIKFTTKSWTETMGCKWLAIPCGGQQMRYPITADSTLDQDTIKAWFDGIQAAGSPIAYVSRFNKKIDRHIYSQIVMLNPALPNDEGTMGMAMALQMPSPLAKAKWTLFGDSLTDNYGGHDLTGKYFASKIAREFGMTLDNRAKSGSNIYRGGSGNYVSVSGMIKLDEFIAEIDAGTTEQPDYITIAFGTNSFTAQIGTNADTSETDTSVYGATKRFIEVLREKCPKSVFGFVLSPKQNWGSADPSNARAVDAARTAIKTVCDDYNVPYIDMSTQSGITVAMLPDGLHISSDQSQNLYYHAMRRFILGL